MCAVVKEGTCRLRNSCRLNRVKCRRTAFRCSVAVVVAAAEQRDCDSAQSSVQEEFYQHQYSHTWVRKRSISPFVVSSCKELKQHIPQCTDITECILSTLTVGEQGSQRLVLVLLCLDSDGSSLVKGRLVRRWLWRRGK